MAEEKTEAPIRLKCIYGNKVKIQNMRTNETSDYTLVTYNEEKLKLGFISNYTEIGKAIWAKHEGDEVEISVSGKSKDKYKIVQIENA